MAGNKDKVSEYRRGILNTLNNSQKIVELVGGEWNEEDPISYLYKYFFPIEYIEEVVGEAKTFINFDMAVHLNNNKTYKDVTIWFFISSHAADMLAPGGLKPDLITSELEELFNDKNVLGIGKGLFVSNVPYKPNEKFRGRLLTYKIIDFSKGG